MRYLYFTNYQSGCSGLSNAIMSIELGVVLAFLTNRLLLLDGNLSPPANIVDYQGRVDNSQPSRVTDLIDLPVPWNEPDNVDLSTLHARELTDQHADNAVFYVPGSVDIESADARSFANGRQHWLCESDELVGVPVLKVSEEPVVLTEARKRANLSFYSYFFYLDAETRRAVYRMLQGMQAKDPYAQLACRVADDLGRFNAVHMRRGDFKVTYGVTVLDRQPWDAIETLDHHFSRKDRLVICTDERDDPFFSEIQATYQDSVFIDHHILDHYGQDFQALPCHDSVALAYLSQLVAAESQDFIGTMTSTFTSIIQRYRGNRGKEEPFKFLWNELPEPGGRVERGRHAFSDCIPLDRGIMIEEHEGPYSWNRYNRLINPAWMREWPESFLTEEVLASGNLPERASLELPRMASRVLQPEVYASFEGLCIKICSQLPDVTRKLSESFAGSGRKVVKNVIAEFAIEEADGWFRLLRGEQLIDGADSIEELQGILIHHLATLLSHARYRHAWLNGLVFHQSEQTILFTGDAMDNEQSIADVVCSAGWELLGDQAVPVRPETREVSPFVRCAWPTGASAHLTPPTRVLNAIVHGSKQLHRRDSLVPLSPSVGLARILGQSIDFHVDRERAIKRLCKLIGAVPVYELCFSDIRKVPDNIRILAENSSTRPASAKPEVSEAVSR